MNRRSVLTLGATALSIAGCTGRPSDGTDDPTSTARPVATSSAAEIEFLVAQIAIREEVTGPEAYYRLRNAGDTDETVKVEAVLAFDDGGTHSGASYADVPAGGEVTVQFRVVGFDELTEVQRTAVRTGEGMTFRTYVNGERRDV